MIKMTLIGWVTPSEAALRIARASNKELWSDGGICDEEAKAWAIFANDHDFDALTNKLARKYANHNTDALQFLDTAEGRRWASVGIAFQRLLDLLAAGKLTGHAYGSDGIPRAIEPTAWIANSTYLKLLELGGIHGAYGELYRRLHVFAAQLGTIILFADYTIAELAGEPTPSRIEQNTRRGGKGTSVAEAIDRVLGVGAMTKPRTVDWKRFVNAIRQEIQSAGGSLSASDSALQKAIEREFKTRLRIG